MRISLTTAIVCGAAAALLLAAAPSHASRTTRAVFCPSAERVWVRDLAVVEGHVQVGISYDEYGPLLTKAQVDYNLSSSSTRRDSLPCLNLVAVPAERALNYYKKAYAVWNACIVRAGNGVSVNCTAGYTDALIQRDWSNASANLDRALRNLE